MASTFNSIPFVGANRYATALETRNGKQIAEVGTGQITGTSAAGAITIRGRDLLITTESLTTAAGATYTLTVTNPSVNVSSEVFASVNVGTSTGTPVIASVKPAAGSVVILIQNIHATVAFNNSLKISVYVR